MPLLALDVEGTIICDYDMTAEPDADDRFPAIIDPALAATLREFERRGFIIVLATGTDSDNLEYYKRQFQKAGIHQYITTYSPEGHDARDSKADKIQKYREQFQVPAEEIYFFDDAENNVNAVKAVGFKHAYRVTDENPLEKQLTQLLARLEQTSTKHDEPAQMHFPKQAKMSENMDAEKELITRFMAGHKRLSKFSLHSRIEENPTSLLPIIENALRKDKNTTSLKTLVKLKWMTKDRQLAKTAPPLFKEKFQEAQQNQNPHLKK